MIRNDQKVIGTGGQFSRGTVSRPAIGASSECLRISEPSFGISIGVFDLARGLIGQAEQDQRRAVLVALVMAFHRHDLGGLMLQRVEAVLIAGENLDRRHQRGHPHRHRKHHPRTGQMLVAQQMKRADGADHQRGGEIGRQHHMHEAIGKRRIEDDLEPVGGDELPVGIDGVAGRRLHPGIGGENPERRDQRADGDHRGREEMQSVADPLQAEQHHAEETRFEEERGQHLIGHQRADHRAGLVGKCRPVGAELVGHHDAGHHAHAEGDGEDLQPIIEQVDEDLASGPQPERFQHREIAGKPDREGRKHDVKRHRECELRPGQHHGIPALEHRRHPSCYYETDRIMPYRPMGIGLSRMPEIMCGHRKSGSRSPRRSRQYLMQPDCRRRLP